MKRRLYLLTIIISMLFLSSCTQKIKKDEFLVQLKLEMEEPVKAVSLVLTQKGEILLSKRLMVDANNKKAALDFYFNQKELTKLHDLQEFAIQVYLFKKDASEQKWSLQKAQSVNGIIQFAPIYGRHYEIKVDGNNKQEYWSSWKEIRS